MDRAAPGANGQTLSFCNGAPRWGICSVQERLDGGETPCQIANSGVPLDSLWGKSYLGGLLAYLDPNTCQGLVAATADLIDGPYTLFSWGCENHLVGGTSTALFAGANNTALILADPTCGSNSLADLLQDVMGTDWDWPSRTSCWPFIRTCI